MGATSTAKKGRETIDIIEIQRGLVETDTDDIIRPSDKRTRGQQRLYQPAATVSVYKYSFFPRTIQEWNTLPTSVTDANTLEEFRAGLGLQSYANCFNKLLIVFNLGRRWLSLSPCWSFVHSFRRILTFLLKKKKKRKKC